MDSQNEVTISVRGLESTDVIGVSEVLGVHAAEELERSSRQTDQLITASFVLAAMRLTPAIISALTDLLVRVGAGKYITFKIVIDRKTVIEGAATPDRLRDAKNFLNSLQKSRK